MAVYTELEEGVLRDFLQLYPVGALCSFRGIEEGVENSNFLLETTEGRYILTLFERRIKAGELPWFLGLMEHLARQDIACPAPVVGCHGQALGTLAGRPAVIVSFLPGKARMISEIDEESCHNLGRYLALLHKAGQVYTAERPNALGPEGWAELLEKCTNGGDTKLETLITEAQIALSDVTQYWPRGGSLPYGQIHADLFPDNVFFRENSSEISGVIDFYFACTDFLAYDLAICLNAWCFREEREFCPVRAESLIKGYEESRPLTQAEKAALPILCQGAALRFLLTRLYDWVNTPVDAKVTRKDPWAYQHRLTFFRQNSCVW